MCSRTICLFLALAFTVGCGERSENSAGQTSKEATTVAFNTADAPTVEFCVPDMMCPESCAVKVKEILSEQPGAKEVVVDFDAKTATVAVDKEKFGVQAAIADLVDHGFDHSTLKSAVHVEQTSSDAKQQPAG